MDWCTATPQSNPTNGNGSEMLAAVWAELSVIKHADET